MKRIKIFILIAASAVGFLPARLATIAQSPVTAPRNSNANSDLRTILDRYVNSVLPTEANEKAAVTELATKDVSTLGSDGSWPDIAYNDTGRAQWAAADHLQRLLVMAKAARLHQDAGATDRALDTAVLRGLRFWLDKDFQNPNWWWNQIGVPQLVGEIASLMLPQLPEEFRQKAIVILRRSEWKRIGWTGANLTWGVTIQIVRGLLQNDPSVVAEGYARLYEEIRYVAQTQEGIQQDDSFHQHGQQLYSGGYGLSFANDAGRFIAFAWGTPEQIPSDRMNVFSAYILDGERWTLRGRRIDYSTIGREIVRAGMTVAPQDWTIGPITPVGPAYGFQQMASLLAALPVPRRAEYARLAASLLNGISDDGLEGNKNFWCSDYMAHRRSGYFTSVKMLSDRMHNAEIVNGEGKKSEHLSDGVNLLYLTGAEYSDVFPAWDWTKLPGTTAVQGPLHLGDSKFISARGSTSFDGGVSDGTDGLATVDLSRGKLRATKSWFFFNHGYLALGAGITLSGDQSSDVVTDVNQTRLSGPVLWSNHRGPLADSSSQITLQHAGWVYHDHVAYVFPANTRLDLSGLSQVGRWSEIGAGSNARVSVPMFNLWIDHGSGPDNATYEYTVLPNVSVNKAAEYTAHPTIHMLANTTAVQAAYGDAEKVAELVFRQPGEIKTPMGTIRADHACALLVRRSMNGWTVTAADPSHGSFDLRISVSLKETVLHLPGGSYAGSSVTGEIR